MGRHGRESARDRTATSSYSSEWRTSTSLSCRARSPILSPCITGALLYEGERPIKRILPRPSANGRHMAKARRSAAPCHSQLIAHGGPCGKPRVVLQNLRPKSEPAEIGEL